MKNYLDKIFVKRYWIGLKGTREFDQLIPGKTSMEAIRIYKYFRGGKLKGVIHKYWRN